MSPQLDLFNDVFESHNAPTDVEILAASIPVEAIPPEKPKRSRKGPRNDKPIKPFDMDAMRILIDKVRAGQTDAHAFFWVRVNKSPGQGPKGTCWEWTGARTWSGHGILRKDDHYMKAHRLAWILTHGPVDQKVVVRHKECDNPPCCNPDHLKSGTHQDNANDRKAAGRGRNHTLIESEVVKIRELYHAGKATSVELSEYFGVCRDMIDKIVHGRKWPNAGGPITKPRKKAS